MSASPADGPTRLAQKMARLIRTSGPMTVADFFAMCLADPDDGYYRKKEPFGAAGDFVTAPEITQLFGEMLGIFVVQAWHAQSEPRHVRLVEIGPGRGTLMQDVLRVVTRIAPSLAASMTVHMVEMSPRLADIQRQTLRDATPAITWHETLADVPGGHLFVLSNELFDALPFHQFVAEGGRFRERVVALDQDGRLCFARGAGSIDPAMLPQDAATQPDGTIAEVAPAREALMREIAARLRADGGVCLTIDYGHTTAGFGDTLQALRAHRFDDPLAAPGEADLTSHVDFEALAKAALSEGAYIAGMAPQGDFLLALGLLERAGRLGAGKSLEEQAAIQSAVERIAGSGEGRMGELFKVLAVTGTPVDLPPFARPQAAGASFVDRTGRRGHHRRA
ncbi:class I SAM-dependent methyltransferase [Pararhizobium haloflavum]|uniref:class I SAM-dependent methyltransferase n=1 Tax=Pararhizobium haloflavum TaxID=2037914 RepID=UPI000C183340|nr:class I SAM-dependent methyltransferase [Pararhizobium haloflavum]